MRLAQRVLDVLADPNIAYLLMMAGMLGLYVEFTHPGRGLPRRRGRASACCSRWRRSRCCRSTTAALALLAARHRAAGGGGVPADLRRRRRRRARGVRARLAVPVRLAGERACRSRAASSSARGGGLAAFMLVDRDAGGRAAQRRPSRARRRGLIGEVGDGARAAGAGRARCSCTASTGRPRATSRSRRASAVEVTGVDGLRLRVRRGATRR